MTDICALCGAEYDPEGDVPDDEERLEKSRSRDEKGRRKGH